jgi:hypothetical protein
MMFKFLAPVAIFFKTIIIFATRGAYYTAERTQRHINRHAHAAAIKWRQNKAPRANRCWKQTTISLVCVSALDFDSQHHARRTGRVI